MSETAVDILKSLRLHDQKMDQVRKVFEPQIMEIWDRFTYSKMLVSAWGEAQVEACLRFPGTIIDGKTGLVVNPYKKAPDSGHDNS